MKKLLTFIILTSLMLMVSCSTTQVPLSMTKIYIPKTPVKVYLVNGPKAMTKEEMIIQSMTATFYPKDYESMIRTTLTSQMRAYPKSVNSPYFKLFNENVGGYKLKNIFIKLTKMSGNNLAYSEYKRYDDKKEQDLFIHIDQSLIEQAILDSKVNQYLRKITQHELVHSLEISNAYSK